MDGAPNPPRVNEPEANFPRGVFLCQAFLFLKKKCRKIQL